MGWTMKRRLLVLLVVTALGTLAVELPSNAATAYRIAVDTMPNNQYQVCVSRLLQPEPTTGASGLAGNFSVPKRTRRVKATIAVAALGQPVNTINMAIAANTTTTTDSGSRWTNIPDDNAVLARASVTPSVSVPDPCSPGQILTLRFPRATKALVPGRTYWLVLRTPDGSSGDIVWYAASTAHLGTATASEYGDFFENGVLVEEWFSHVPGLFVPNAYRVEVK